MLRIPLRRVCAAMLLPAMVALGATGCGSSTVETDSNVASIRITPVTDQLKLGSSFQLDFAALNAKGQPVSGADIKWTSGNSLAITVSSSGVVTAVSYGLATIQAKAGKVVATMVVTTEPKPNGIGTGPLTGSGPLVQLRVNALAPKVTVGNSIALTVYGLDQAGNSVFVGDVSWSTRNSSVATVSSSGVVSALTPGTATVVVSSATNTAVRSDSLIVTVTNDHISLNVASVVADTTLAPSQRAQLIASYVDAFGKSLLTQLNFSYSSSNEGVVYIGPNGAMIAMAEGVATITVTSGQLSATKSIVVKDHGTATATLVHTVAGINTITIGSNGSPLIPLTYAQQQVISVPAIDLAVTVSGMPTSNYLFFDNPFRLLPGRSVAIVAIGSSVNAVMFCLCDAHAVAPTDKAQIRVLIGSTFLELSRSASLYVVPSQGALTPSTKVANDLRFTNLTPFQNAPVGSFDLVVVESAWLDPVTGVMHDQSEIARFNGLAPAIGKSTTYVIAGPSSDKLNLVPIVDR